MYNETLIMPRYCVSVFHTEHRFGALIGTPFISRRTGALCKVYNECFHFDENHWKELKYEAWDCDWWFFKLPPRPSVIKMSASVDTVTGHHLPTDLHLYVLPASWLWKIPLPCWNIFFKNTFWIPPIMEEIKYRSNSAKPPRKAFPYLHLCSAILG